MSRGILAGAAMGAVFFVIPAVVLTGSLAWLGLRLWRGEPNGSLHRRTIVALRVARDPLQLALLLMFAGAVLAGFVAGDLGPTTYLDVAGSTLVFVVESLTDWSDATTSESIALRGFGFIVVGSSATVAWSLWRYFNNRWQDADQALRRDRLGSR